MKKALVLALLGWFLVKPLFAAEFDFEAVDLERIVITPTRTYQTIDEIPQAVSVITQEEIASSNAQSVVDVLRFEPGILVRDYYGTGTRATVDLRGFGEAAPSNVLVLVDGRRVNEIDISGPDWTQIPLDQIERIEVSRGGSSVLYGDNAIGGVINIITKKGKGKPRIIVDAEGGSYNARKNYIDISGSKNDLSYSLRLSDNTTDGYRANSYYHGWDLGTRLAYDLNPFWQFALSAGYHDADFGLPGSLSETNLNTTYSRRDSKFPDDRVGETDGYIDFEVKHNFAADHNFSTAFSWRERRVDDLLESSFLVDGRRNNTFSVRPKYSLTKEVFGRGNNLLAGLDLYFINTIIDEYGTAGLAKTRDTDIDRTTHAFYLQNDLKVTDKLLFTFGYRKERAKTSFDSTPLPGDASGVAVNDQITTNQDAHKLGLNYNYKKDSKVFLNYSRNFRLPATDEYFSVWSTPPVNVNLRPQISWDKELGIEHRFNPTIKMDLTLFRLDLKNELYYDPSTFANNNYSDKTRHQGIEYGFELAPLKWLTLNGTYTYTDAKFRGGTYDKNTIPAVPVHQANVGAWFKLNKCLQWYFSYQYTGKSYLISDQRNQAGRLDSYSVFNSRISFKKDDWDVFVGVNNLFNEKYSEYAVTNATATAKNFYPAPERNFVAGVKKEF